MCVCMCVCACVRMCVFVELDGVRKSSLLPAAAIAEYNHAFCDCLVSFWRLIVKVVICIVFQQMEPLYHCRLMHQNPVLWTQEAVFFFFGESE